jgi:hypothetical protein
MESDCLVCGRDGDLPVVDSTGVMHGYVCIKCDERQHRRQLGWRRRVGDRMRWLLKI